MGAQHSTVGGIGRAQSLDDSSGVFPPGSNGTPSSGRLVRQKSADISSTNRSERDLRSRSTLVVVNRPEESTPHFRLEDDPLFKKLSELPMFVPLMHEVDTGSKLFGSRGRALAEIRERIDPSPFIRIVRLYEDRLKRHAEAVHGEQGRLTKCTKEADATVLGIFKTLTERQKKFAKHADSFGKMQDLTHSLLKCQTLLRECERSVQILNGILPIEERLEPFSWSDIFQNEGEDYSPRKSTYAFNTSKTSWNEDDVEESVEIAEEPLES